jgi:hypothetical protein
MTVMKGMALHNVSMDKKKDSLFSEETVLFDRAHHKRTVPFFVSRDIVGTAPLSVSSFPGDQEGSCRDDPLAKLKEELSK